MNNIAFLTDWGISSYYVSVCKSVIKKINGNCDIIDITHNAGHFNIKKYAAIITRACKDFEYGTVFLCVVDPSVGSSRKAIAFETLKKKLYFVGPDNGLFSYVIDEYEVKEAYELTNKNFYYKSEHSSTFHGRDIFSPAAAYISKGISLNHFGPKVENLVTFNIKKPKIENNQITCDFLYKDDFGNIETNLNYYLLSNKDLGKKFMVEINGIKKEIVFVKNYSEVKKNELLIHLDSSGYYEISKNMGNAAQEFNIDNQFEGEVKIFF